MDLWHFVHQKLTANMAVFVMVVVESEGSSPGRRGFKMAVAADGTFMGTIGGGIMEHKLVEKCKSLLRKKAVNPIELLFQYHDKQHPDDQSGMICSGHQVVAFVPLGDGDLPVIGQILSNGHDCFWTVSPDGFVVNSDKNTPETGFFYENKTQWRYCERVFSRPVVHIVGGGHVGLALSEVLHFLGFYIHLYDDREDLNTMGLNRFAHEKHLVSYENIGESLKGYPSDFVVIVTVGYRQDKLVFRQLLMRPWRYLGMMGSATKVKTLLSELENEGLDPALWQGVFTPIGLPIFSKTAQEIAVSIAAQMVLVKNGGGSI